MTAIPLAVGKRGIERRYREAEVNGTLKVIKTGKNFVGHHVHNILPMGDGDKAHCLLGGCGREVLLPPE